MVTQMVTQFLRQHQEVRSSLYFEHVMGANLAIAQVSLSKQAFLS
jgi:hypothetical protein